MLQVTKGFQVAIQYSIQGCYTYLVTRVVTVLQRYYKSVTRVLQGCYEGATRVLQGCYKVVTSCLEA
jgi:hypothetical protein